jgi:hypothetical protein
MPACDLDCSVAFCFYNKREKPNTVVSVFSGEVHVSRCQLGVRKPRLSMQITGDGFTYAKSAKLYFESLPFR